MFTEILLIAPAEADDEALVAAAAAHRPRRVTVVIPGDDPAWSWSPVPAAARRRDRLAHLLTAVERATGAAVVGLVGDPARLDVAAYDAVVGGRPALTAA